MTAAEWLEAAKPRLSDLDSRLMLEAATGLSRERLIAHPETNLTPKQLDQASHLMTERLAGRPMSQILGQREFYGLDFIITPDVLTPRTETEVMVERVVTLAPRGARLIDIGTGCGAIAISIAKNRPDITVAATDISQGALKIARQNAAKHHVKIELLDSNLFSRVKGAFDVITANLPYLRDDADLMPEVGQHEPRMALLGGTDGLELYRRFFISIKPHLAPRAMVVIEADPWQHDDLIAMAKLQHLSPEQADYFIITLKADS